MIVFARKHVEREREREREKIQKEEKKSQSGECDTDIAKRRSGQVTWWREWQSKLAERGKREERERKETQIGSGDCQSGDRQATMQTGKWMPEEAVWTGNGDW